MKRTLSTLLTTLLVIALISAPAFASNEVVVSHWGGTLGDAFRACYFDDFEKDTGITVVEISATNNKSVLKAMVETNSVDIDLMQGSELEINELGGDYLAEVDYSKLPKEIVDNLTEAAKKQYGVGAFSYASIIAYRTDAFPEGQAPTGWADFWDVEKFPGMRTMVSGASGDYPPLEYALLADGVAKEDLYPLDVDRAFKKLEELAPNIAKWWMAGADAPQMLINGEVTMAEAFSGRIVAIIKSGAPVKIVWDQGRMNFDFWQIPKGAPNYDNAMLLLSYMNDPVRQAKFAEMTGYAPSNALAYGYMSEALAASLATSDENLQKVFPVDNKWWAENMEGVVARWLEWESTLE